MKHCYSLLIWTTFFCAGCSSNKFVKKNNRLFRFKEEVVNDGSIYKIVKLEPQENFNAEITEKSDYIVIKPTSNVNFKETNVIEVSSDKVNNTYLDLLSKYYYPEIKNADINTKSLRYYDIKFGLQALNIPLKFRQSIGNDTINPPNVETGFNIGFAPGWKFTKNIYQQNKNYLGKNTTQLAFAIGPHFGLGAVDLKKASNAPQLLSDRKGPIFTWGGYLMLGINNINLGVALGRDYVLGQGSKNWVYQNKTWRGVIISLDILKY